MPFHQRRRRTFDDLAVLYLHHTDPAYIAPPRYSVKQITGGPFMKAAGDPQRLCTPSGEYDLPTLLRTLPEAAQPEIVLVWADATRANLPRNLGRVPAVKVLMIGDTHHLDRPLEGMIEYARAEPFDLVLSAHNRQHLHFFREAGVRDVVWLPNVEASGPVRFQPPAAKAGHVASSGQIGDFHPARRRLVTQFVDSGVPFRHRGGRPEELLSHYGEATVALNCSLNGDVNLRVAEVLSAGGCLLTDRLSPQSGIDRLLEEGREVIFFASAEEAVVRARHLLAHPEEAQAIARRGWEKQIFELGFAAQRRRLLRLIETGQTESRFDLVHDLRCAPALASRSTLPGRLALYQHCQESNRLNAHTAIGLRADVEPALALDLIDLHRCHVVLEEGATAARLRALAGFAEVAAQIEVVTPAELGRRSIDILVAGPRGEAIVPASELGGPPAALWLPAGRGAVPGYRQDVRMKELFRRTAGGADSERGAA